MSRQVSAIGVKRIWAAHNSKIEHFLTSFFASIWGFYIVRALAAYQGLTILTLANVLIVGGAVSVAYVLYDRLVKQNHLPGFDFIAGIFGTVGAEILWLKVATVVQ